MQIINEQNNNEYECQLNIIYEPKKQSSIKQIDEILQEPKSMIDKSDNNNDD